MPPAAEPAKRRIPSVLLSVSLHVSVLACALLIATAARNRMVEPAPLQALTLVETAGGSHAIKIQLPTSDFAAHIRTPNADPEAAHKSILPIPPKHPDMAGGGSPKAPHTGDGSGSAAAGNGSDAQDARPAFPVFSPRPPVTDRALLPATEEKIVVDVDVDAAGQVVKETLVRGLGGKLDQIVLDAVRSWRFQPATVNGTAVASEAELVFPFTPDYPLTVS